VERLEYRIEEGRQFEAGKCGGGVRPKAQGE